MAIPELGAGQPKHWGELDDKQKVNRTREVVQGLQDDNRRLQGLVAKLLRHRHGNDGMLMIDLLELGMERSPAPRRFLDKPDETYF